MYSVGNFADRGCGGNLELYDRLEARLASIRRRSALLFATSFLTNLGVLPALVPHVAGRTRRRLFTANDLEARVLHRRVQSPGAFAKASALLAHRPSRFVTAST